MDISGAKDRELTAEQSAALEKIRRKQEKKELKCRRKLEKVKRKINKKQRKLAKKRVKLERKAVRKQLKWGRKAAKAKRKAEEKRAEILGVERVKPIERDLDALESGLQSANQSALETAVAEAEVEAQARAQKCVKPAELLRRAYPELYETFCGCSFLELEQHLREAGSREEKAFYRSMLNLKLQIEQEKVVGEVLL